MMKNPPSLRFQRAASSGAARLCLWLSFPMTMLGLVLPAMGQECVNYLTLSTGEVQESALDEISGIALSRKNPGVIWAHNDSGDSARVFAMSTEGTHLGVYNLVGASHIDFEDMAIGRGPDPNLDYLYLGDVGDNGPNRSNIVIYRVPEPSVSLGQSPVTQDITDFETIVLTYPEGAKYDCETIMVDSVSGNLYLVTKTAGASTRVFVYPSLLDDPNPNASTELEWVTDLTLSDEVTGGDISPSGSQIILRPKSGSGVSAMLWHWTDGTTLADVLGGPFCSAPLASEPQGEAIAFASDELSYYTMSEIKDQPVNSAVISQYEEQGPVTDGLANGEVTVQGVRNGTLADTYSDNGAYESITEVHSGGKPKDRFSTLEHQWTFNVPAGDVIEFHLQAHHDGGEDDFVFAYSTDGSTYTDMVTVERESDDPDAPDQIFRLLEAVSGAVTVRVVDTNSEKGELTMSTIFVDDMFFRSLISNPAKASNPSPASGAINVPLDVTLSWDASAGATSHEVYFGTDSANLVLLDPSGPGQLAEDTIYYWRVDAYSNGAVSVGDLWSFTTMRVDPPATIVLSANGYKVKGVQFIELSWSGTTSNVTIYRDGNPIPDATSISGTSYTDATGQKGAATYVYHVCEIGTDVCSDTVTVTF